METPLVCIVESDPAVRDSLATLVELSGHGVATFATGQEFLMSLGSSAILCVICDDDLPDARGVDVFARCRQHQPDIRFALLSSRCNPAGAAAARARGVDAVFRKPLLNGPLQDFLQPMTCETRKPS